MPPKSYTGIDYAQIEADMLARVLGMEWREVEGLGRCLVPIKPRVTEDDVRNTRTYFDDEGRRYMISAGFDTGNKMQYQVVLILSHGVVGLRGLVSRFPTLLAASINGLKPGERGRFARWATEEERRLLPED